MYLYIYILCHQKGKLNGAIRQSHSTLSEKEYSKQSSQPSSKRQREERENPIILVKQGSTATLVEETINEGSNFSVHQCSEKGKKTTGAKIKASEGMNHMKESCKGFLLQFIQAGLITKSLNLELISLLEIEPGVFR